MFLPNSNTSQNPEMIMSSNNTIHDKGKTDEPMKDKKSADAKKTPELSAEELKKVVGGNLGAPIYKKKP
jgi:hypothetical protein